MRDMMSLTILSVLLQQLVVNAADSKSTVIVKVDKAEIRRSDLDFAASQQGIEESRLADEEPKLIDQLIEAQLIRGFLARNKIEPIAEQLNFQIAEAEELIRKRGEDPQKLLAKLGYTPDRLKRELGLPLAWKVYVNKNVTDQQLKEYFNQHKTELDGTQLRASQIFLKLPKSPSDNEIKEKTTKLADLRRQIVDKKLGFADAAKEHSESPSRDQGGDVGLFGWRGKLPAPVAQAAFALEVGEISQPIVSPFGVHLIEVTERHSGELSLEDVRTIVLEQLSKELWKSTVAAELKTAKIERFQKSRPPGEKEASKP